MLEWNLKYGEHAEMLEAAAKRGLDVPAIRERQRVWEENRWVWDGFSELSNTRASGFSVQPIQIRDVEAWLGFKGIAEPQHREFFWNMVRALDAHLRAHMSKKAEKPRGGTQDRNLGRRPQGQDRR